MNRDKEYLAVQIVQFVDDSFPGWVECRFADATGRIHMLVEKYPIVTAQMLDAHSQYPQSGEVQCEVLNRSQDARGEKVAYIRLLGIESTEGQSEFVVLSIQLSAGPTG